MKLKCAAFVALFAALELLLGCVVSCAKLPDIYWNSSNPIFLPSNANHIFDVNKNSSHEQDQVDIVCPSSGESAHSTSSEKYVIYSVSKDEYDSCKPSDGARRVAVCDGGRNPRVTVTFRSFTPQPNGLEFKAGQDYYFITAQHPAASSQMSAHSSARFAPCHQHNMKVIFRVCCSPHAANSSAASAGPPAAPPADKQSLGASPAPSRRQTVPAPAKPAPPSVSAQRGAPLARVPLPMAGSAAPQVAEHEPGAPITVLPIEKLDEPSESPSPANSIQSDGVTASAPTAQAPAGGQQADARANRWPAWLQQSLAASSERPSFKMFTPTPLPPLIHEMTHRAHTFGPNQKPLPALKPLYPSPGWLGDGAKPPAVAPADSAPPQPPAPYYAPQHQQNQMRKQQLYWPNLPNGQHVFDWHSQPTSIRNNLLQVFPSAEVAASAASRAQFACLPVLLAALGALWLACGASCATRR